MRAMTLCFDGRPGALASDRHRAPRRRPTITPLPLHSLVTASVAGSTEAAAAMKIDRHDANAAIAALYMIYASRIPR